MATANAITAEESRELREGLGIDATNQIAALAELLAALDIDKMDSHLLEDTLATIAARLRCLAQVAFFAVAPDEEFDVSEMRRRMNGTH